MKEKITKLWILLILLASYAIGGNAQTATAPSGSGTSGAPYEIATLNNLYWLATQVNAGTDFSGTYFKQTANIDASATSDASWNSGAGWTAIGGTDNYYVFSGSYDGQGYTISNLYINNPSVNIYGLFGYCANATLKNIGLTNVSISAGNDVGGLVGYIEPGTISNCYVTGTVKANGSTGFAGGLCGEAFGTTIDNCYAACTVVAEKGAAGGLVAYLSVSGLTNSSLTNSYSSGSVIVNSDAWEAGGLLGSIYSGTSVEFCFSESSVSANGVLHNEPYNADVSNIGGLIGLNGGTVANCYAKGSVTVTNAENESGIGGLFGENTGTVSYCYTTGSLSVTPLSGNTPAVGGFVGVNYDENYYGTINNGYTFSFSSGTVSNNCFWNSEVYANGCGSNSFTYLENTYTATFSATGKTTTDMKTKSTFTKVGWDFVGETENGSANYWGIGMGYPYLISSGMKITTIDFPSGSDDISAFTKTYDNTDFTITPVNHNYSSIELNSTFSGFYSYDYNTDNGTEFTISASGYSFDLGSFKYYLESDRLPSLTVTLTFIDGSTDTKTYTFTETSTGVYTFTGFTTTANDVKSIKFVSDNYMTFNNFSIEDIKVLPVKATVTTASITTYTATSATMAGQVTDDGGASVNERGVVYSINDNTPTINEQGVTKAANGHGIGLFSESISGLNGNTTYYVRAYAINSKGTSYGSVESVTTEALTVVWDGTSWTPSAPLAKDNVLLYGDYNDDGFTCNDMIIAQGKKVTFKTEQTISGVLIIDQEVTILNDANINVSGNAFVQQAVTGTGDATPDGRFWYVSSPVSGAKSSSIKSGSNKLWYYDEPAHAYSELNNGITDLTVGKGYVCRVGEDQNLEYQGKLNDGDIPLSLSREGTTNEKRGFNLIGNPYLSYLNWDAAYGSAQTQNMSSSVWGRTEKNGVMVFTTYNAVSNEATLGMTQNIAPMQGFWVRVEGDGNSGALTFTNAMRGHESGMLKSDENRDVIRLTVSNGTNSDEAVAVFAEGASNGYDAFDSPKMSNNNADIPEIYMTAGNEHVSINGLESPKGSVAIPVGFNTQKSGGYTIALSERSGLDNYSIELKDMVAGTTIDLSKDKTYSFSAGSGDNASRFNLTLKSNTQGTEIGIEETATVEISTRASSIVVASPSESTIVVSDILGRTITSVNSCSVQTIIDMPVGGVYFVNVTSNGTHTTKKVVICK